MDATRDGCCIGAGGGGVAAIQSMMPVIHPPPAPFGEVIPACIGEPACDGPLDPLPPPPSNNCAEANTNAEMEFEFEFEEGVAAEEGRGEIPSSPRPSGRREDGSRMELATAAACAALSPE